MFWGGSDFKSLWYEPLTDNCLPYHSQSKTFMINFCIFQVLFALNWTLWQHESYRLSESAIPYTTDDLIQHYNCGDLDDIIFNTDSSQVPNLLNSSLPPSQIKTAEVIDKYFRTELINKRNERMAYRVANLLKDNPHQTFFFAFGAGKLSFDLFNKNSLFGYIMGSSNIIMI